MTIFDMLGQSGILAVLGMGIVFSFLIVMVIAISIAGKVIGKFGKPEAVPIPSQGNNAPSSGGAITAAISAAVNEYRKSN